MMEDKWIRELMGKPCFWHKELGFLALDFARAIEAAAKKEWKQRQAECAKCQGIGYRQSEAKHEDGVGQHAWAARCECQPTTMQELADAVAQERHD